MEILNKTKTLVDELTELLTSNELVNFNSNNLNESQNILSDIQYKLNKNKKIVDINNNKLRKEIQRKCIKHNFNLDNQDNYDKIYKCSICGKISL